MPTAQQFRMAASTFGALRSQIERARGSYRAERIDGVMVGGYVPTAVKAELESADSSLVQVVQDLQLLEDQCHSRAALVPHYLQKIETYRMQLEAYHHAYDEYFADLDLYNEGELDWEPQTPSAPIAPVIPEWVDQ